MTEHDVVHGIILPMFMWGHLRPLLYLSLNLLTRCPYLRLSFVLFPTAVKRVSCELEQPYVAQLRHPTVTADGTINQAPLDRLQLIAAPSMPHEDEREVYMSFLPVAMKGLLSQQGTIEGFSNRFAGAKISFVLFDMFNGFTIPVTRKAAETLQIPLPRLMGWFPSNAAAGISVQNEGYMDQHLREVLHDTAQGMSRLESFSRRAWATYGDINHIPGMTPRYDWEHRPMLGAIDIPVHVMQMIYDIYDTARDPHVSVICLPAIPELEPEGVRILKEELDREILMLGPQYPDHVWDPDPEVPMPLSGSANSEVLGFLDRLLRERGPNSVVYFSCGTSMFPTKRPELHMWLHQVMVELDIPFVYPYDSVSFISQSALLEDHITSMQAEANVCLTEFAPQWAVLRHPAVGTFITHASSNCTSEAIMAGVAVITTPVAADQVEYAHQAGAAIDLVQIKTPKLPLSPPSELGHEWQKRNTVPFEERVFDTLYDGRKIIGTEKAIRAEYRDVLRIVMGPQGETMRQNMALLRTRVQRSLADGGANEAMMNLIEYM